MCMQCIVKCTRHKLYISKADDYESNGIQHLECYSTSVAIRRAALEFDEYNLKDKQLVRDIAHMLTQLWNLA